MAESAQQPNDPPRLFATNRLMLACPESADPQEVLNRVNEVLNRNQAPIELFDDSQRDEKEQIPYQADGTTRPPLTAVFGPQQVDDERVRVLSFAVRTDPDDAQPTEDDIIQSVQVLDRALTDKTLSDVVVAATPNWLVATCPPAASAFGGPGGRPVPVTETDVPYRVKFYPRDPNMAPELARAGDASGVIVVLLDTAPSKAMLQAEAHRNELMTSLADHLEIHTDPAIDAELASVSITEDHIYAGKYDYDMVSHGVFAAGLIHSIMPKAEIHLVRALNDSGIGTVASILRGMEIASEIRANNPRVPMLINLSLTLVFPYLEARGQDRLPDWLNSWDDLWAALEKERAREEAMAGSRGSGTRRGGQIPDTLSARMRYILELAVLMSYDTGAVLVAAAGNERKPDQDEMPVTMFPAAFDEVIGVGALRHFSEADPNQVEVVRFAPYSCKVDKPAEAGFAIFGGDIDENDPSQSHPQHGVVGLWINSSGLPSEQAIHSDSGWVRWSGTSFAAPILSGLLAIMLSQHGDSRSSLQQLHNGWVERTNPPARVDIAQVVLARQE